MKMETVRAIHQGGGVAGDAPKAMTLNERLDSALTAIESHCDRVERFLNTVNAAPTPGAEKTAQRDLTCLAGNVDRTEATAKRMYELLQGIERIA